MEELGKGYVWLATKGFYTLLTITAVLSLPNPLAIVWLGFLTVGITASYLDLGGRNGK
jgi:hypothetical protein|tara:strand:+ start:1778 stop:1951 length:174 start_codon:yes stop_codon:yes gene_type:complete